MKEKYLFSEKELKNLIVPLAVEQILVMSVGIADSIMVSHAGEAAVSGVALVDMINTLIIMILSAVCAGGTIVVSQYIGDGNREKSVSVSGQLVNIASIISLVITIICLIFHKSILRLFFGKIETEVMSAAVTYFTVCILSYPFLGIYNSGVALFRAMGKTEITMKISFLGNIINILGNFIGVFVLKAGIIGVAVPTLISRIVSAGIIFLMLLDRRNMVFLDRKAIMDIDKDSIIRILKIAIPSGMENGLFQLGKILTASIVALFGTVQIAANGVSGSIIHIAVIGVNAINLGIVTVVGQCVGARRYGQVYYYVKKLMKWGYLMTMLLHMATIIFLPFIFSLYSLSDETVKLCYFLVIFHNSMIVLLHPTSFGLANAIRAAGDVRYTMYVGVFSMFAFRLGFSYLLGIVMNYGVKGVWAAMALDWIVRSAFFVFRFKSGKWRRYRVI